MNKIVKLVFCLASTLAVGAIAGIITASSVDGWYQTINKPSFTPPNFVFGPVWTILYLLMGISFHLVLNCNPSASKTGGIIIFSIQLFLNFCWSLVFFTLERPGAAFAEIIILWIAILLMIRLFFRLNKAAAYLQIPYLLWVSFATVLTGSIWMLNQYADF